VLLPEPGSKATGTGDTIALWPFGIASIPVNGPWLGEAAPEGNPELRPELSNIALWFCCPGTSLAVPFT